jgi:hypothetical protein
MSSAHEARSRTGILQETVGKRPGEPGAALSRQALPSWGKGVVNIDSAARLAASFLGLNLLGSLPPLEERPIRQRAAPRFAHTRRHEMRACLVYRRLRSRTF